MASDAEHLFIYLWALCNVFLGEVSVKSLPIFYIGLFFFLEWTRVSSLHILEIKTLSEKGRCLFSLLL